uniref:HMA domain-containing protein n=1 Tax=Nelumbo nucifera TaxID=4432 RepID=A0A822Z4T6_NELNU|nr:TPA_asm: hypothetical protein HUJ06_014405 [Nelumbo nucifera]
MKQKIVIKVDMHCDDCRHKAMRIAAEAYGVISVKLDDSKDKLEVVGNEVDTTCLTNILRKKVGYAVLITIEEVKPPKPPEPKPKADDCPKCIIVCPPGCCCVICVGKKEKVCPQPPTPTPCPKPCPPGCCCIICIHTKVQPAPTPPSPWPPCPYNRCPPGCCYCQVQVTVNDITQPNCSIM